ncbi:MAG: hypothetical protein GX427_07405 [Actinomycetales bacterium]|nr:hypothetical protein [Actinomycetales bacterium]
MSGQEHPRQSGSHRLPPPSPADRVELPPPTPEDRTEIVQPWSRATPWLVFLGIIAVSAIVIVLL